MLKSKSEDLLIQEAKAARAEMNSAREELRSVKAELEKYKESFVQSREEVQAVKADLVKAKEERTRLQVPASEKDQMTEAVGVTRSEGGKWHTYRIILQGDRVLGRMEIGEPQSSLTWLQINIANGMKRLVFETANWTGRWGNDSTVRAPTELELGRR